MKAILCTADETRRGFVTLALKASHRSQRARFGVIDAVIVTVVLLGTAAIVGVVFVH